MKVLIFGGNGGIGYSLCKCLLNQKTNIDLHATYHNQQPEDHANDIKWHRIDITSEQELKSLACQFSSLDLIINAVGLLHSTDQGPEKNLQSCQPDFFLHNMAVNALPTLMIAKYFSSCLSSSEQPKFITISAKVGSIEDNKLGGWYSYRSSKAALNMLIKNISIEWSRRMPKACILSIHPGTTDTALSKPFQANVPTGKLFSPDKVAADILDIMEKATPESSGSFLTYDGQSLPW
ncbi:SDR family oxidoreductase [Vibrio hepatarius]|uniref:SDR family oxidoreductase n=1 Tax=Vibrio hepatarius TaxID=171383 RepID=UPI001C0A2440|nr:SDR family oxidoreductase [Vibrio hepatarius]MBU2897446.1 SDR family oxidoreductase [Vibrio hepatarius]